MQLSAIWSDGMVIQRDKPIRLSGRARGNEVTAVLAGRVYRTAVQEDGCFSLEMDPMEAGGPYELALYDGAKTVISDIWFGDVWILGGQSNMELPIVRTLDVTANEVSGDAFPNVRLFHVPMTYDFHGPRDSFGEGCWQLADKKSIYSFPAVGYFMGKELAQCYQVPVGLIATAIGGTPAEAWMSRSSLEELGICGESLTRNECDDEVARIQAEDQSRISQWYRRLNEEDPGLGGGTQAPWYSLSLEEAGRQGGFDGSLEVPGMWEGTQLADYKGSVWFCTAVEIPGSWCAQELLLRVGSIIDADDVYVNGVLAGHTDYRYPPRKYLLPPGLLCDGINTIWVRVVSDGNPGGFMPGKPFRVERMSTGEYVRFDGSWHYRLGKRMEPLRPQTFFQYEPSGVYNGMIAPLRGISVKGIAFYQGESNDSAPQGYAGKLRRVIRDWRAVLGDETIPFLYVQLAAFGDGKTENTGTSWAVLRREQEACTDVSFTGMVSAIDLGEYNDLHPQNKAVLGRRLARAARSLAYGEAVSWRSPRLSRIRREGEYLVLEIEDAQGGLAGSGRIELAGDCKDALWAEPEIEGGSLKVRLGAAGELAGPSGWLQVSYGWENYPSGIGIHNKEGLPLLPFKARIRIF